MDMVTAPEPTVSQLVRMALENDHTELEASYGRGKVRPFTLTKDEREAHVIGERPSPGGRREQRNRRTYGVTCSFDDVSNLRQWIERGGIANIKTEKRDALQLDLGGFDDGSGLRISLLDCSTATFGAFLQHGDFDRLEDCTLELTYKGKPVRNLTSGTLQDTNQDARCHNFYLNLKDEVTDTYPKRAKTTTEAGSKAEAEEEATAADDEDRRHSRYVTANAKLQQRYISMTARLKKRTTFCVEVNDNIWFEISLTAVKTFSSRANGLRGIRTGHRRAKETHEIEIELQKSASYRFAERDVAPVTTAFLQCLDDCQRGIYFGEVGIPSACQARPATAGESREVLALYNHVYADTFFAEWNRALRQLRGAKKNTDVDEALDVLSSAMDRPTGDGVEPSNVCMYAHCLRGLNKDTKKQSKQKWWTRHHTAKTQEIVAKFRCDAGNDPLFCSIEPRVVTLSMDTLPVIQEYNDDYIAFVKTDGTRQQGIVYQQKVYLLMTVAERVHAVIDTGGRVEDDDSDGALLDGELYTYLKDEKGGQGICYFIFDVYGTKRNSDLIETNLKNRLETVRIESGSTTPVRVKKPWEMKDVNNMFQNNEERQDGIVFTPRVPIVGPHALSMFDTRQELRHSWATLLKWKSVEDNTIDCRVVFDSKDGQGKRTHIWVDLYVKYNNGQKADLFTLLERQAPHYRVAGRWPQTSNNPRQRKYEDIFYPSEPYLNSRGASLVECSRCHLPCNPISGAPYFEDDRQRRVHLRNGDIVEMRYELNPDQSGRWIPLRMRPDKSSPNMYDPTALSVWKNVYEPLPDPTSPNSGQWWTKPCDRRVLQIDCMTRVMKSAGEITYYRKDAGHAQNVLPKWHNYIKGALFEYVTHLLKVSPLKDAEQIVALDIGYGQGGDMHRYNRMSQQLYDRLTVIGLENDWQNLHKMRWQDKGAYARYLEPETQSQHRRKYSFSPLFLHADCSKDIRASTLPGMVYQQRTNAGYVGRQLTHSLLHYDVLQYLCNRDSSARQNPILTTRLHLDTRLKGVLYNKGCHVVACSFALHYFFDVETEGKPKWTNFMNLVKDSLHDDGYVMITLVCSGDIPAVQNALQYKNMHMGDAEATPYDESDVAKQLQQHNKTMQNVAQYTLSDTVRNGVLFTNPTIMETPEYAVAWDAFKTRVQTDFEIVLSSSFGNYAKHAPSKIRFKITSTSSSAPEKWCFTLYGLRNGREFSSLSRHQITNMTHNAPHVWDIKLNEDKHCIDYVGNHLLGFQAQLEDAEPGEVRHIDIEQCSEFTYNTLAIEVEVTTIYNDAHAGQHPLAREYSQDYNHVVILQKKRS